MQRLLPVVFLGCLVSSANLNAEDAVSHFKHGRAWILKGENDKAITDLNEAIRLKPEYSDAYLLRGTVWERKGEYEKAIADCNHALAISRNDAQAYVERSTIWRKRASTTRPSPITTRPFGSSPMTSLRTLLAERHGPKGANSTRP